MKISDKPTPVRNLRVTDITESMATVRWEPPEDEGGKPVTAYIVEKRDASRRSWSSVAKTADCEVTVSDLVENNQYVFRVIAESKVGVSEPVESETITAKSPFGNLL